MTKGHYDGFGKLKQEFGEAIRIVLFPCNQFLSQEPGMPSREFVRKASTHDLWDESQEGTPMLMEKVNVNGEAASPVFEFLKYNSSLHNEQTGLTTPIPWNFGKFLLDKQGQVFKFYSPKQPPNEMRDDIAKLVQDKAVGSPTRRPTLEGPGLIPTQS